MTEDAFYFASVISEYEAEAELTVLAQLNSDTDNSTGRYSQAGDGSFVWFTSQTSTPAVRIVTSENIVGDCPLIVDQCGICGGPGAIYECGCDGIPVGDCDCDGNQSDAIGICGGTCTEDQDNDGICDDIDDCVGLYDACGICNGPGPVAICGCDGIPAGDCDCDGNQSDAIGICGGTCTEDEDNDGICDDVDPCIGIVDAIGVCGGDCEFDQNNNGICDLQELENGECGPESCGVGTIWEEETQTCVVAYPGDLNFDGCVQLSDLLNFLTAYGNTTN